MGNDLDRQVESLPFLKAMHAATHTFTRMTRTNGKIDIWKVPKLLGCGSKVCPC